MGPSKMNMSSGDANDPMGISLLLDSVMPKSDIGGKTASKVVARDVDRVIHSQQQQRPSHALTSDDDDYSGRGGDDDDAMEAISDDDDYTDEAGSEEEGGSSRQRTTPHQAPRQAEFTYDRPAPRQAYVDPEVELAEKREILYQFDRLAKRGCHMPRVFNLSSDLAEMRMELERVKRDRSVDGMITFSRNGLMMLVTGVEWLNDKFFPEKVKLSGWARKVQEDIQEYDDIFEEILEKYRSKGKLPPELRLLLTFAGSAVMCHLMNTLFKDTMPGMDQVLRQNPKLVKDLASAVMSTTAGNHAPGMEGANPLAGGLAGMMSGLFSNDSGIGDAIGGLFKNFAGAAGGGGGPPPQQPHYSPNNPAPRPPPPMPFQTRHAPLPMPPQRSSPRMRGPTGFDKMMNELQGGVPPTRSRIETFSNASASDISELRDEVASMSESAVGRRRRVLNL